MKPIIVGVVSLALWGFLTDMNQCPGRDPDSKPAGAVSRPSPSTQPAGPWEASKTTEYAVIVPKGWRRLPEAIGPYVLYLNADGIGAPAADQEGPIQVGFTVERYGTTREAAAAGAKRNQESATRNPRLKVIKAGKVEELKLSDGTEGAFTRTLLLKEGSRLSLQMKLFAKDKDSRGWVVSAWIVTGKDSKFIENNPGLEQVLKAHMASLCFRPEKLSTDGVAKAHSLLAQSRPASVPASSPATAPA